MGSSTLQQAKEAVFRYQTGNPSLTIGKLLPLQSALNEKLEEGGLGGQIAIMKRRVLNTEQELIALAHAAPDTFDQLLLQLEGVVEGECAEAELIAQQTRITLSDIYGPVMMADVYQRLRDIAKNQPKLVHNQPYEMLVGVAGLLTEKCTVWWSNKFQLQTA